MSKSLKNIISDIIYKENQLLIDSLNQRLYMWEGNVTIDQNLFSIDWKDKSADEIIRDFAQIYNQYAMASNGHYWPQSMRINSRTYIALRNTRLRPNNYCWDRTVIDYISTIYNLQIEADSCVLQNALVLL